MMRIMEGFDHMATTALLATKGWSASGAGSFSIDSSGRINGRRLKSNAGNNSSVLTKNFPSAVATAHVGFAFMFDTLPTSDASILVIRAGTANTFVLAVTSAGKLKVTNSGGGTGATTLTVNTWYYIEAKVFINGASGTSTVHLNGASEIGTTTHNLGSTNVDNLQLYRDGAQWGTTVNLYFDDVYMLDTSGSTNNGFLGDFHVETLFPTSDGAHTDFTPDSGSAHYSRVNENSGTYPDGDTSYVSDATVGDRDSYGFGNLTAVAGTVYALQTCMYARKDDAGTRQLAAVARPGSTDRDGATVTMSVSYTDFTEIRETNPDTSAAWTISEINASEFGVKVVA